MDKKEKEKKERREKTYVREAYFKQTNKDQNVWAGLILESNPILAHFRILH